MCSWYFVRICDCLYVTAVNGKCFLRVREWPCIMLQMCNADACTIIIIFFTKKKALFKWKIPKSSFNLIHFFTFSRKSNHTSSASTKPTNPTSTPNSQHNPTTKIMTATSPKTPKNQATPPDSVYSVSARKNRNAWTPQKKTTTPTTEENPRAKTIVPDPTTYKTTITKYTGTKSF